MKHHWRITQDGLNVAGGHCSDHATMLREMYHYAALYAEEGPVHLETRSGKGRWEPHIL